MKAVVKTRRGEGNIEIKEVSDPKVRDNEVKIEVKAAGICGTDIHIYHGVYETNPPVILGHEFAGIVAETGRNVRGLKVGEPVTAETSGRICGKCKFCQTGNYNICSDRKAIGVDLDGAFTKFVVVKQEFVHKLPENVDVIAGSFCEPIACSVHAVMERGDVKPEQVVMISGPGVIGLLTLQVVKAQGSTVVVCGRATDKYRLAIAKALGADYVMDVDNEDVAKLISELTDGYGADVVFECAGASGSAKQCLKLVRRQGKYVQMGLFGKPIEIDFEQIVYKELQVIGAKSHKHSSWDTALNLLGAGKVRVELLMTGEFPITEWQLGFEKTEKQEGLKVLLRPV